VAKILSAGTIIELTIPTPDEPCPVLVLRNPTEEERDMWRRKRVKVGRHQKIELDVDCDVRFIDAHLQDVRGAEIENGEGFVPLDTQKQANWKSLIPKDWKLAAAAYFQVGEAEAEEKNS
jgi:hypothetical protein